jgi:hypothetical protein
MLSSRRLAPAFGAAPGIALRAPPGMARRRPRCCAAPARVNAPVVRAPMTGGADVLFPGGSQLVRLVGNDAAVQSLCEASLCDPPVFAFTTVDAWGAESPVGTLAVIDEMKVGSDGGEATVLCSGLGRWQRCKGGIEEVWDDPPREEDAEELRELDEELVLSLMELVRLSMKVAGSDPGTETALAETLKRMEALCAKVEAGESSGGGGGKEDGDEAGDLASVGGADEGTSVLMLQHWVGVRTNVNRRRELLGFITLDLMNMSFMARTGLLESTDTKLRLQQAKEALEPFLKELAAKAAIVSAFGSEAGAEDASPPAGRA